MVAAVIGLTAISLEAQGLKNIQATAGLSTMWIINDNAARESIVPRDETDIPGAGFDGQQIGFSIRMLYNLNEKKKLRLTTGLDYYFMRGVQRNQLTSSTIYYTYAVNVPTIVLGTEYAFVEYPPGDVRIYAGIEARGAFTSAEPIDFRLVRLGDNTLIQSGTGQIKDNAFRLGGAIRLGVDGEIYEPMYVNISAGYGILNLIGRDDTRGELFTPNHSAVGYTEERENYIHNVLFSFLLQYRF